MVSMFSIVIEKKINVKIDFRISLYDSVLLKIWAILRSLNRQIKSPKIIRLKTIIIQSILKYMALIDSTLFLAFKRPE